MELKEKYLKYVELTNEILNETIGTGIVERNRVNIFEIVNSLIILDCVGVNKSEEKKESIEKKENVESKVEESKKTEKPAPKK